MYRIEIYYVKNPFLSKIKILSQKEIFTWQLGIQMEHHVFNSESNSYRLSLALKVYDVIGHFLKKFQKISAKCKVGSAIHSVSVPIFREFERKLL